MIIGITGYGYTGSGAVSDLLKEYSGIQVQDDFEFTLSFWPDGLEDLEYHLVENPNRFFSSDISIKRFKEFVRKENRSPRGWYKKATHGQFFSLSMKYIDSLTDAKWQGRWMVDPFLCNEFVRTIKYRFFARIVNRFPCLEGIGNRVLDREMCFSIRPEDFLDITKAYTESLLQSMGYDTSRTVCLDQPFSANNPIKGMRYYKDSRAIIVTKDPRDLYVLLIKLKVKWVPLDNVNDYVLYYKKLYETRYDRKDILYVAFEDLIYNYQSTVDRIEQFCSIRKEQHIHPKQHFIPNVSIQNTQIYLQYPEYSDAIAFIEKELHDYLFDFSNCEKPVFNGKLF